ncbi:MAG: hypothetical protein DRJ38_07960 [Thermoprotei archaeon]|nr:MAG: hypothetical protein DRJ38_07960 [Thermoprotei archaeon]
MIIFCFSGFICIWNVARVYSLSGASGMSFLTITVIVAFANHAVIKEQLFTLADYLTIAKLLGRSNIDELVGLVEETRSTYVMKVVLGIVEKVIRTLHADERSFNLPLKLSFSDVLLALCEKMANGKVRASVVYQFLYLSNLEYFKSFMVEALKHVVRMTY